MLAAGSTSTFDQPGTLGFLVVAGMAIVLVFLFRSMAKHLRKVRGSGLPSAKDGGEAGEAGATGQAQASAPADEVSGDAAGLGFGSADAAAQRDGSGPGPAF